MPDTDLLVPLLPSVRVPGLGDNVYKEECCFSFDTPKSDDGLYICLSTFLGFNRKYVELFHETTGHKLFLHMKQIKKILPKSEEASPVEKKKPKRLAIGIEGGFDAANGEKVEYEDVNELVILPEFKVIGLENIEEIPSVVLASVSGILASTSASKKEEELSWDGEIRPVSKHADKLQQLDNGVKIPPSGWKCCKCDLTSNLWLNLTDGKILCGRRYFDGTGGNNHAVDYFKETKYPLAVKLGTITAFGADVHSYDEDTMVEDPHLAKHLSHFGINMMNMHKTEQTMTELEIELNEKVGNEWDLIQESGKNLKQLQGPGLVGLNNMGNTCYMNSVIQVLYSIPEFLERYTTEDKCRDVFKRKLSTLANLHSNGWSVAKASNEIQNRVLESSGDFTIQLCKLGLALTSPDMLKHEDSTKQEVTSCSVTPRTMKRIVGRGHPEFSTNRQQDTHEFLLHVLSVIERSEHKNGSISPGEVFRFMVEDRIECQASKQVRYTKRSDYALALPIPLDAATNKAAVDEYQAVVEANKKDVSVKVGEVVRPSIPYTACIEAFAHDELIQDFWSSAVKEKAEAKKRSRFVTFPDYLVVQMKKFTVGEDWVPKKLDVSVEMPDILNLNDLRGGGLQKDEMPLPDIEPPSAPPSEPLIEIDEEAVIAISQMGFPLTRCRDALVATGNMGVEAAVMWLMENNTPEPAGAAAAQPSGASDGNISSIVAMGFTEGQAKKALHATGNNLERAADWIFSHLDELDSIEVDTPLEPANQVAAGDTPMDTSGNHLKDGLGNYELFAFISHMGSSTMCGHYVCHIKKDGRWVIFNDEKVAESEQPPKDLGYIYFYKRA
ncbi:ubiquitin carboxyl-terminal hydrolase 5 [Ciona intestinalis]